MTELSLSLEPTQLFKQRLAMVVIAHPDTEKTIEDDLLAMRMDSDTPADNIETYTLSLTPDSEEYDAMCKAMMLCVPPDEVKTFVRLTKFEIVAQKLVRDYPEDGWIESIKPLDN
jgi:hypothetical protein